MSGGSYDYVCFKIKEAATNIRDQDADPRRAAFAKLLDLVGNAMHDIEWVDSSDYEEGYEYKSIDAVFSFLQPTPEIIFKANAFDRLSVELPKLFKSLEAK